MRPRPGLRRDVRRLPSVRESTRTRLEKAVRSTTRSDTAPTRVAGFFTLDHRRSTSSYFNDLSTII